MKRMLALLSVFACVGMWAGTAHGAGYAFFEQGAASTGRQFNLAHTTDGAAGFYNPAGLADLDGLSLSFGGTYTLPFGSYESNLGTFDRVVRGIFPPNLHLYYSKKGSYAVGLSVYNAFGLGIEWPDNFPGAGALKSVKLLTPTVQPNFAWRINDKFSIGVGVSIIIASAKLERVVSIAPFPAGYSEIGGDGAIGVGGNIGFLFSPTKRFRIGLHYRSAVKLALDGKANFTFDPSIPDAVQATLPSDQTGSLEITTPHIISLGFAYDVTKNLTLGLDFNQYMWSVFDELRLKFGPPQPGGVPVNDSPAAGGCTPANAPAGVRHICSKRDWMDVPQFRLGAEWRASKSFTLRGGYTFDLTPVPSTRVDPTLPDATRHDFSIGIGYQFSKAFRLDFAYFLVIFLDRDAPARFVEEETGPGRYTGSTAHLFALSFGLNF